MWLARNGDEYRAAVLVLSLPPNFERPSRSTSRSNSTFTTATTATVLRAEYHKQHLKESHRENMLNFKLRVKNVRRKLSKAPRVRVVLVLLAA
jgi:hypothetical protein